MIYQALYNVETMYVNQNTTEGLYTTEGFRLFDEKGGIDVLSQILGEINEQTPKFKLGIQAPPGTQFLIGEDNVFIMGAGGTFEVDENTQVPSLIFVRPNIYVKDDEISNNKIKEGQQKIQEAYEYYRSNVVDAPNWEAKLDNTNTFINKFQEGKKTYEQGIRGIYISQGQSDLYNIIIDIRTTE